MTARAKVPSYPVQVLSPVLREIPVAARADMRVPVRIYADDELWRQIAADRSVEQCINVATLPGVTGHVYAMPDMHEGYGFPVGGVAATRAEDGVISPGGVGYDINCGVRLLASDLELEGARAKLEPVVHDLSRSIPSGPGRNARLDLGAEELDQVLERGCRFLVERGLAAPEDLETIESEGSMPAADARRVSAKAKQRGHHQLGTLGSGNHFVEVQVVDRVFEPGTAESYGLRQGQLTMLIHTGSRGLGHQVCTDYVRQMDQVMAQYRISLPDRQLACAPLESPAGQAYFAAMCAAANFAWANRQAITESARTVFKHAFGDAGRLRVVYDVAHNIAKLEEYGGSMVCVHRKGATRAFGPANRETPERYRSVGQPVFIPGSMGTVSYVLAGNDAALDLSFGSTCHGAGRAMSRGEAKRARTGAEVRRELDDKGIIVRCASSGELAEEAPSAYKDVERVVDVVHRAGLARKVARLRPVGVIKG
jgi:tRNA-splicing ligase RtcB (3'-phosphate/5'-hydroxy nucleic acid ligase)